jgi:D-sedoheptulose 7-phosphate isomerase
VGIISTWTLLGFKKVKRRKGKMTDFRERFVKEYLKEIRGILDRMEEDLITKIDILATELFRARENGNTIFMMGNGGSASTASHFAGDLSKGTLVDGFPRFKAIALTDNIPNMLAWANDKGYEHIFVEQLRNLMEPGDIVIGISGSGNSENVIRAIEYANEHGAVTVGFSGFSENNKLMNAAKINVHVPSSYMQRVEDIHLVLQHLLTSLIRGEMTEENT